MRFVRFEVTAGVGNLASAAELRLFTGTPKEPEPGENPGEEPEPGEKPGEEPEPGEKPGEEPEPGENPGEEPEPGEKPGENPNPVTKVKVKKVSISAPSKKIAAGKKVSLSVAVSPKNASNRAVKWTTSNKKYATVNSKGVVTAKKAGKGKTVTVTAAAKDGSGKKASVRIQIMKHAVTKVTVKNAPKTLKAGKKITLKTVIKTTGKNANKTLKWTSSNKKYATVSTKGKVTAKKAGKGKTVTIRAVSTDGTNKKASVKIRIR